MHVKDEMVRRVAFVMEDDDMAAAYASMKVMNVRHVPVIRGGKLVGMLSDRDILLHSTEKDGEVSVPSKKVKEAMSRKVVTCTVETPIAQVADLMLEHRIHCVPVVNKDKALVGIITSTDLLRILRDNVARDDQRIPFQFEAKSLLDNAGH